MKLAKKSLSIFLALLMMFSACSVGLTGITAFAAAEDSEYTAAEVADLINAATAGGFSLSSSGNAWNYAADDGKVIAAAEAIFDYALNAYREGKEPTSKGNSSKALYDAFIAEFQSKFTNKTAADRLVKNVLDPDGTTVYAYGSGVSKSTTLAESETSYGNNVDVTATFPITSYPGYYAAGNVTKTVEIGLDLNKYLMTFDTIEDIPSTVITNVKFTYAHGASGTATATETSRKEGSGCNEKTYYTTTIKTSSFHYMPAKPNRQVVKDKTIRKTLLTVEKYFNEELLSTTKADMLAMSATDIKTLYDTTELMYNSVSGMSDAVLNHFGLGAAAIHQFMDDVYFAYRVVTAKYNVDNLNNLIGTEYNKESYAEMSAHYAKTSTAYDVVFNMDQEIINYITSDEGGYAGQYASAVALKATAESYNATLFDIMTEQKLEETVAAMVATYTEYINVLNKEDIENPSDAEVIGLVQKVDAFDAIIASYTGYSYYRTYWTAEYEAAWAEFSAKLDEVYEVRGLKAEFQIHYDYFLPLIYTTMIDELDNAGAIALHSELDTKLSELRTTYNEIVAKWGGTIADKIFTVTYNNQNYLLQTLIDSVKATGKDAVKNVLVARTEAQLDAVYAYKDTTVVNFDNFASIKSTLTYFDYDLYNYVNGGGEGQNNWLSTDYTNKYVMVQTLLDRYHAFSTTDGKAFFKEDFTFADANGYYGTRYAGSQYDADGNQIGYPTDIARDGADDNYVVTEEKMVATVAKIDSFIVSRDFGALIGLTDMEDEDVYVDLATYVEQMLNEMLYNDALINTLVGAIYPMVVDLLNTELVGMLADMGTNDNPAASACIDIGEMTGGDGSGHLYVYMDDDLFNGQHKQRNLDEVLADAGLYVYPQTLADSLLMSNPVAFGVGTPIYTALKAAGRDWTQLVCADDPETEMVDETKILEFEWGVYDSETFVDTLGCIFDSLLPLLNAVLTGTSFNETLANAAYAYSTDTKYIVNVGKLAVFGDLNLQIPGLTVYNDVLVPLFEILGVDKIPTLKSGASGDQIAKAIVEPLLSVIDEVLANPLSTVLEILPNLVYFLSMDSVQEILDSLNISLHLKIEAEVDKDNSGTLVDLLGGTLLSLLGDKLSFDVNLAIADLIDLYDMLGFEISDFNEVLKLVTSSMGIALPPMKQQEIIFCSDWSTSPTGRVYLDANKGDLMYWFIDYVIKALVPDENGNSLLTSLLGTDMDPTISGLIEKVVSQFTNNPRGALAAIVEIINPTTYDLKEMNWVEGSYNYNGIEGANQMSIVYLNYGNDWTKEKSQYLLDNAETLIDTILTMTGAESMDLGAMLQDTVNGLFTNANITALVKMLGGLGDSPSAVINDVVKNQVGINIGSWFTAFGYLFPADTWAEDAVVLLPTDRQYVNNFGVEGVANEDGTISWFFNRMPLNDGDGYTFVNILSRLLGEASLLIEFLFAGEDVSAFENLLTVKGYETYDTTFGLLFEMLGVENIPTQADFNTDAMGSFTNMLIAVLDWFYALTSSDDMIAQLVELLPDLFCYLESNGLSTLLHNLLMPVLVLVDTVRPLMDVDVNGIISILLSELVNTGTVNLDSLLGYITHGIYMNDDPNFKWINVDINNLTLSEIIKIVDAALGTNLYNSGLVQIGVKGFCSGLVEETTAVGTVYKSTVDAADTITILVTALLDCLDCPAADETKTNGDVIFALIAELAENETIANLYPVIKDVIAGVDITYAEPDWGYMFESADAFSLTLPQQSIVYLGYSNDWDKETAASVYDALDDVLALVLPSFLEENETLATLVNGLLEDNVYSDEIFNSLVELIVNAIAMLDDTLRKTVDTVLDTNIAAWFDMCTYNEETGAYECTKDWGIDAAPAAEKKALFVAALKEVLTPAERLLSWLFFGNDIALFTGSEVDAEGNYVYNDIININGGEGYAYGIAPILEALGCELKPASAYTTTADAVEDILNSVFALVDKIAANPVEEVFALLPNLIYFINADGVKVAVNNLLAPVNGILEAAAPLVGEVSIGDLLADAIGFNIADITTDALLQIAADNGVKLSAEMVDIICNLYVGNLEAFESVNGRPAYRLNIDGFGGDVLTIILSIAIDLFNLNKDLFADLLGEDVYFAVKSILAGAQEEFTYRDMNWAFMYEGEDADSKLFNDGFPAREGDAYTVYTMYQNNWNKATADYLTEVLYTLVRDITDAARSDGSSLGMLLDDAIVDGLYQDDILNSLIEMVVELLIDYEDLIKNAGALLGAEGLAVWFDEYCEITTDENGETVVTCVKDWGVDAAATNAEKRTAFVEGFVEALQPAYRLLAWLFFGEDYTFLAGTTGENLITIKGGKGYENAFVPLLEGVCATMNYEGTASGIKPASAFYVNGELDMEMAVRDIFTAVSDWLYLICGDLSGNGTLDVMLDILPTFINFVNADGLKVVVNNLLQPVNFILDELKAFGVEVDFATLIEGIDITNFDFYAVFDLLEDLLDLYFPDYTQNFLATFYIGEPVAYESANGKLAYRIAYTEKESKAEMITCVISFVVDAFQDPRNDVRLSDWLGADVYQAIIDILKIEQEKPMQEFSWYYTDAADTGKVFTPIETSELYTATYNKYWTKEKAQYLADNVEPLIANILDMAKFNIEGQQVETVAQLADVLVAANLYTQANADAILEAIKDLISMLTDLEPYGEYISVVLKEALGVDIHAWDNMTVEVVDGDRATFSAAISTILAPVAPLLKFLLAGEDFKFFYSIEDMKDALVIYGSEGYAYGIIPLLEALGCTTVLTPAEYKAAVAEDDANAIACIIEPLFDRIDAITADPINEIVGMLPALVYFINSNGLDTVVKNLVNSVDTVMVALEPLVGVTSVVDLLGIDLATYDFEYLFNMLIDSVEESTGLVLKGFAGNAINELTTGTIVSYESKNGETYYTMKYASESDKADMVTVMLRLVLDFITQEENIGVVEELLAQYITDETAYKAVCTVLEAIAESTKEDPSLGKGMALLYYFFFGISETVENADDIYHDITNSWEFILRMLETSKEPLLNEFAVSLKKALNKNFGTNYEIPEEEESEEPATSGVTSLFDKIAAFFKKIGDFFKKLFGIA